MYLVANIALLIQGSVAAVADPVVLWVVGMNDGRRRSCGGGGSGCCGCSGNLLVLLERVPIPLLRVDGLVYIVVVVASVVASIVTGGTVRVGVSGIRSNGLLLQVPTKRWTSHCHHHAKVGLELSRLDDDASKTRPGK